MYICEALVFSFGVKNLKTIRAFVLIALLAVPNMSLWLNFRLQTQTARVNARQIIVEISEKSMLQTFVFSKDYFEKIRIDDIEFEISGKLYDIVSAHETSDSVYLTAWHDTPESLIKKQYKTIQQGLLAQNPVSNDLNLRFFDFSKNLFCSDTVIDFQLNAFNINFAETLYFFVIKDFTGKFPEKPPCIS